MTSRLLSLSCELVVPQNSETLNLLTIGLNSNYIDNFCSSIFGFDKNVDRAVNNILCWFYGQVYIICGIGIDIYFT